MSNTEDSDRQDKNYEDKLGLNQRNKPNCTCYQTEVAAVRGAKSVEGEA